jgi:dTDP-4-dehydrorhamnose reductase
MTGATGYVGTYLRARLQAARAGEVHVLTGEVTAPDLVVPPADVVIHLAGKLNSFHGPKDELERANYDGTVNVASRCAPGTHFIFLSTDLVFSSDARRAYTEADPPRPETTYGRSKARAEQFLASTMGRLTILRTSALYGYRHPRRQNTFEFIESRLRAGTPIELYRDVYTCPTFVADLAACIELAMNQGLTGVHHACGAEYLNRCEIGEVICRARGYSPLLIRPVDRPTSADVPRFIRLRASPALEGVLTTPVALALRSGDAYAALEGAVLGAAAGF